MLQHAIGKAAGGGANIDTLPSLKVDLPPRKRGFQFETAAAYVALRLLHLDFDVGVKLMSRLGVHNARYCYLPGQNQASPLLARFG